MMKIKTFSSHCNLTSFLYRQKQNLGAKFKYLLKNSSNESVIYGQTSSVMTTSTFLKLPRAVAWLFHRRVGKHVTMCHVKREIKYSLGLEFQVFSKIKLG